VSCRVTIDVGGRGRPILETRSGRVLGAVDRGVYRFLGVPYGGSTAGAGRWRPPVREEAWRGSRDGRRPGSIAPQRPSLTDRFLGTDELPQSEDCLNLNVWTPPGRGSRPVMVFLHGGGFLSGAPTARLYAGAYLARQADVVVVTVTYRLGALGFGWFGPASADDGLVANAGLSDVVAALEWVREHAGAIGGDARRVMLFGESAGAMAVGTLLGMPSAHGLFQRAALQSGAASTVLDAAEGCRRGELFLRALGLRRADPARLAAVPLTRVLAAQDAVVRRVGGGLAYQPIVDGGSLPRPPLEAVADRLVRDVPLLIGTNRDELNLFGAFRGPADRIDEADLSRRLHELFGPRADAARAAYSAARPGASPEELWAAVLGDRLFRVPALRLAEAQADADGRAYLYLFTWRTPVLDGRLGACHGLELPFVFRTLDEPGVSLFTGDGPDRAALAATIGEAWAHFAATGEPAAAGLPPWPAFDRRRRATMLLDSRPVCAEDPFGAERRVWEGVP